MDYTIEAFVEKLLKEKGISGLDDATMRQLRDDLVVRVENITNSLILENMPKDKMDDFEKILDSGNEKDVQEFCKLNIPNMEELVSTGLLKLRSLYLSDTLTQ